MDSTALNFCKLEQMSICTADTIRKQGDCSYFEKSQHADRCMYYIFDEYCDCLTAQINAGGSGSPDGGGQSVVSCRVDVGRQATDERGSAGDRC